MALLFHVVRVSTQKCPNLTVRWVVFVSGQLLPSGWTKCLVSLSPQIIFMSVWSLKRQTGGSIRTIRTIRSTVTRLINVYKTLFLYVLLDQQTGTQYTVSSTNCDVFTSLNVMFFSLRLAVSQLKLIGSYWRRRNVKQLLAVIHIKQTGGNLHLSELFLQQINQYLVLMSICGSRTANVGLSSNKPVSVFVVTEEQQRGSEEEDLSGCESEHCTEYLQTWWIFHPPLQL